MIRNTNGQCSGASSGISIILMFLEDYFWHRALRNQDMHRIGRNQKTRTHTSISKDPLSEPFSARKLSYVIQHGTREDQCNKTLKYLETSRWMETVQARGFHWTKMACEQLGKHRSHWGFDSLTQDKSPDVGAPQWPVTSWRFEQFLQTNHLDDHLTFISVRFKVGTPNNSCLG